MNLDQIIAKTFADMPARYSKRDTMLYALGVQAIQDPLDTASLRFVYERELQALPSLACVVAHPGMWIADKALEVNVVKLVHAEQHFALDMALPVEADIVGRCKITGVVDKGAEKGALLYFTKELFMADGRRIGKVDSTYFLRADGGTGNWGTPGAELPAVPETAPSGAIEVPTLPIAGLIYRLSGDYNPLHSDPEIAKKAGFEKPILHGLCTYGIACQSLIRSAGGGDASRLRAMGARFTKPVYPGETIRTEYWTGANGALQFRCISLERKEVVLDRGTATLVDAA